MRQDEIAQIAGLSQSQVSRRLSLARRYRQEQERREQGLDYDDDRPEIGDEDAEWLELRDSTPEQAEKAWYSLADDSSSHDGTSAFVWVGTGRGGQPRRNRIGSGRHVDTGQSYKARDDGLKGGKGC